MRRALWAGTGAWLALLAASAFAWDDRPTATDPAASPHLMLRSPRVAAWVARPGGASAFYDGRRFETAGAVGFLAFDGVPVVGWGGPVNGGLTLGLIGEFVDPIPIPGSDHVAKVGVGILRGGDPRDPERVARFTWVEEPGPDPTVLTLQQVVRLDHGFAYRLSKSVALETGGLRIRYRIENTGSVTWRTRHYTHNFLAPGGMAAGAGLVIRFPHPIERFVQSAKLNLGASLEQSEIRFAQPERPDAASLRVDLAGAGLPTEVTIWNPHRGVGIRVETDWEPRFYRVFATWNEVCPEPYFEIDLAPGESASWSLGYAPAEPLPQPADGAGSR